MDDLIAFLNARLDEDEVTARAAADRPGAEWTNISKSWDEGEEAEEVGAVLTPERDVVAYDEGYPEIPEARHIARHDPSRVLREVAAKRAIIAEAQAMNEIAFPGEAGGDLSVVALRALASVYADHLDYRGEWQVTARPRRSRPSAAP